jgi:RNA polymerase sigma-70 factor (ECF subfamily)
MAIQGRADLSAAAAVDGDDAGMVAAARRDRRAFDRLYDRYADRVLRYALARTGSAAVADDITSDTFVAAMEGLARYDPARGSFAAWLFTIAARRIADYHRTQRRRWEILTRRAPLPPPPSDDALDTLIRDEDARRVRAALARLSEPDRHIVLLRYSAGLSGAEIAAVLGISDGTARVRLSRALARLAKHLGPGDEP